MYNFVLYILKFCGTTVKKINVNVWQKLFSKNVITFTSNDLLKHFSPH